MFTKYRTEITSEQVVQELLADPNSPWGSSATGPNKQFIGAMELVQKARPATIET